MKKAWVLIRQTDSSDTNEGVPIRVFLDKGEADLIMAIENDGHPHSSPLEMVEVPVGLEVTVIV